MRCVEHPPVVVVDLIPETRGVHNGQLHLDPALFDDCRKSNVIYWPFLLQILDRHSFVILHCVSALKSMRHQEGCQQSRCVYDVTTPSPQTNLSQR